MDPITSIGNLLDKPHLEDETVALINEALRKLIKPYAEFGLQKQLSPEEMAEKMLGPNVLDEWLNGPQGKGGET